MSRVSAGRRYALLLLPLLLDGCSLLPNWQSHRHVAKAVQPKPDYQAGDFVQHLSLASLTLADGAANTDAAAPDLDVLQSYTAQPRHHSKHARPSSVQQQVAVLECKAKGDGVIRTLAAPFATSAGDSDALLELLNRSAHSCPLYNIWPATVTVRRSPPLVFADASPEEIRQMTAQRLDGILHNAARPGPLTEAKTQMQLARIFIDNRQRDGAYIAVENAKQSLAAAEGTPDNKEAVKALLQELESMESEMQQTMPFTL